VFLQQIWRRLLIRESGARVEPGVDAALYSWLMSCSGMSALLSQIVRSTVFKKLVGKCNDHSYWA